MAKSKAAADGDVVTIKKYANRRLYDTERSCYITLDDLGVMVRDGHWRSAMLTGGKGEYLLAGFFNMMAIPSVDAGGCCNTAMIPNEARQVLAFFRDFSYKSIIKFLILCIFGNNIAVEQNNGQ